MNLFILKGQCKVNMPEKPKTYFSSVLPGRSNKNNNKFNKPSGNVQQFGPKTKYIFTTVHKITARNFIVQ